MLNDIKKLLQNMQLLNKDERYWLYFDLKTSELNIYSVEEDDIWTITIDELGDIGFN